MKKLLLFLLLVLPFSLQAQYRFYAGIQGGPKLSYSNLVFPGQNEINFQVNRKVRHQEGFVAGYNFRNNRLSLEAAYSRQTHGVTIRFPDHPLYGKTPELWYTFNGDQVALTGKFNLTNPEAKVRVLAAPGGAYFMKWQVYKSNFFYNYESDRYGFLVYPYAETPDRSVGFKPNGMFEFEPASNIWLVQTSLEVQTNISNRLMISVSGIYQNSITPADVRSFTYSPNYSKGVLYEPEQTFSTVSKAEALNFNLGLYYCFSKRD